MVQDVSCSTPHRGRVALFTGQVGLDKRPYLEQVTARLSELAGAKFETYHVGQRMYQEDPSIKPGKILQLTPGHLGALRRAVMRDAIGFAEAGRNLVVNTHATFRWKGQLFESFDFEQLKALAPDIFLVLVDDIFSVHRRMLKDHDLPHTLKDILVWREEEIMATRIFAKCFCAKVPFFIVSRGNGDSRIDSLARLVQDPSQTRIYPSFPMTHVMAKPDIWAEVSRFRDTLAKQYVCFDPGDIEETIVVNAAKKAEAACQNEFEYQGMTLSATEILGLGRDIDRQICGRDFAMIDQSDLIASYIPELEGGRPGLSSGVERELEYSFRTGKDVFVVWKPKDNPSPFITANATEVVPSVDELFAALAKRGYAPNAVQ